MPRLSICQILAATMTAALLAGCEGEIPLPAVGALEQLYETVRGEAEALGGGAVIVYADQESEFEILSESSDLYGTHVSVPAGALPDGVASAVLSVVPVSEPTAASYQPQLAEISYTMDTLRRRVTLRVQTPKKRTLTRLEKPVYVAEPVKKERVTRIKEALILAETKTGMCDLIEKEKARKRKLLEKPPLTEVEVTESRKRTRTLRNAAEVLQKETLNHTKVRTLPTLLEQLVTEQKRRYSRVQLSETPSYVHNSLKMRQPRKVETRVELAENTACTTETSEKVAETFVKRFRPVHFRSTKILGDHTPMLQVLPPQEEPVVSVAAFDLRVTVNGVDECATTTFANNFDHVRVHSATQSSIQLMLNLDSFPAEPAIDLTLVSDPMPFPATGESLTLTTATVTGSGRVDCPTTPSSTVPVSYDIDPSTWVVSLVVSEWVADAEPTAVTCGIGGNCLRTTGVAKAVLKLEADLSLVGDTGKVTMEFNDVLDRMTWEVPVP